MIWLNGTLRPAENAVSANDRGLLLGEAVFETLLVDNNVPQFWAAHNERLFAACAALGFERRFSAAALADGVRLLLAENVSDAARRVLRLTVTGGAGGRGLVAGKKTDSNWLMQISSAPTPPYYLRLFESDTMVLAGAVHQAHKTTNYLDNILARRAALQADADEAIMLNQHGRVAAAAAGNLFVQKGRQLITPPLSEGALPGIIRAALLASGDKSGLGVTEGLIGRDLLAKADALFVSNSVNLIVPAGFDAAVSQAQKKQGLALRQALPHFTDF